MDTSYIYTHSTQNNYVTQIWKTREMRWKRRMNEYAATCNRNKDNLLLNNNCCWCKWSARVSRSARCVASAWLPIKKLAGGEDVPLQSRLLVTWTLRTAFTRTQRTQSTSSIKPSWSESSITIHTAKTRNHKHCRWTLRLLERRIARACVK